MGTARDCIEVFEIELDAKRKLRGTRMIFDAVEHVIVKDGNGLVVAIDDVPLFGTEGQLPRYQLLSLAFLQEGSDAIRLNVDGLYEPSVDQTGYEYVSEGSLFGDLLRGFFSDGAGSYVVEWGITGTRALRTKIEQSAVGEELVARVAVDQESPVWTRVTNISILPTKQAGRYGLEAAIDGSTDLQGFSANNESEDFVIGLFIESLETFLRTGTIPDAFAKTSPQRLECQTRKTKSTNK